MDEIVEYLLTARHGGHGVKSRDDTCSPTPAVPASAEQASRAGAGAPDLLSLLLDRLGDETVRRAIARLIVPR